MNQVNRYKAMASGMFYRPCSSLGYAGNELCFVQSSDGWLTFPPLIENCLPAYPTISPYDARRLAKWILEVYGEEEE